MKGRNYIHTCHQIYPETSRATCCSKVFGPPKKYTYRNTFKPQVFGCLGISTSAGFQPINTKSSLADLLTTEMAVITDRFALFFLVLASVVDLQDDVPLLVVGKRQIGEIGRDKYLIEAHDSLYDFTITSRPFLFFEYRPERFQRASRLRKDGHWIVASNPSKGSARLYNTNPEDVQDFYNGFFSE